MNRAQEFFYLTSSLLSDALKSLTLGKLSRRQHLRRITEKSAFPWILSPPVFQTFLQTDPNLKKSTLRGWLRLSQGLFSHNLNFKQITIVSPKVRLCGGIAQNLLNLFKCRSCLRQKFWGKTFANTIKVCVTPSHWESQQSFLLVIKLLGIGDRFLTSF